MKTTRNYSNEIENFSVNSLYDRANVSIPLGETVITQSKGNEIIRIIHNAGKTFVSTQQKHVLTIQEYLYANDIIEKLCSPSFYCEILDSLGYDPREFLLEPSEEFLQDIQYNCVHMLDYVCTKDTFILRVLVRLLYRLRLRTTRNPIGLGPNGTAITEFTSSRL